MSYISDLLGDAYKEGMTEDELSAALEAIHGNRDAEMNKLKNALSKANSEAADWKKKLRDKQSDDENKRQEEKEQFEKIAQENAELKRSIALTEKKAKLIGMGYEEKMAEETATAMIDGDMDKVLEYQSKYLETQKKTIETDLLKKTPRPKTEGDNGDGMNYDKLIQDAREDGNYALEAYYTRLREQENESE